MYRKGRPDRSAESALDWRSTHRRWAPAFLAQSAPGTHDAKGIDVTRARPSVSPTPSTPRPRRLDRDPAGRPRDLRRHREAGRSKGRRSARGSRGSAPRVQADRHQIASGAQTEGRHRHVNVVAHAGGRRHLLAVRHERHDTRSEHVVEADRTLEMFERRGRNNAHAEPQRFRKPEAVAAHRQRRDALEPDQRAEIRHRARCGREIPGERRIRQVAFQGIDERRRGPPRRRQARPASKTIARVHRAETAAMLWLMNITVRPARPTSCILPRHFF